MRCPWDSFRQSELVFCEASRCAWIKEPANTWSNLGYLAAALYMLVVLGRRTDRPIVRVLAVVVVPVALGVAAVIWACGWRLLRDPATDPGDA